VRDFSVVQNVQNGFRPYLSSYSVGTGGSYRIWGVRLSADLHLSLTLRLKIIAACKMKTVAFKGTDPVRSEIVMNINIIVQINTFTYLCCFVSCQNDNNITVKISKFLQIMGIINRTSNTLKSKNTLD